MQLFTRTAKEQDVNDSNVNASAVGSIPMPARHPRPLSEVAARAAQHVHDLEMTIETLQTDIHALTARLTVADERARVIQAENEFLMKDRDYHKERCVRIETKFGTVAHLILDALELTTKKEEPPAITLDDLSEQAATTPRKNGKKKNGDSDIEP